MNTFAKIAIAVLLIVFVLVGGFVALTYINKTDYTNEQSTDSVQDEPAERDIEPKVSESQVQYQRITPDEAQAKMEADVIILDVRTPEEFGEGHVPNALLLPDYDIAAKAAELLPDKDKTILVYCRSGRRSQAAAVELIQMGYTQVYDFGGIIDWTGETEK